MSDDRVLEAFGEQHVERLTGLTRRQLRYWDKTGFFKPSRAVDGIRVYTLRDLVTLLTLGWGCCAGSMVYLCNICARLPSV